MSESERHHICAALEAAHHALRCVDASDPAAPQTAETFAAVSNGVRAVEQAARDLGYCLMEFRGARGALEHKAEQYFDGGRVYGSDKPRIRKSIFLEIGDEWRDGQFRMWMVSEKARAIAAALIYQAEWVDRWVPLPVQPSPVSLEEPDAVSVPDDDLPF